MPALPTPHGATCEQPIRAKIFIFPRSARAAFSYSAEFDRNKTINPPINGAQTMNNWNFTGNLGRDSELRTTTSGHSVLSFTVAVKSGYGDKATTTWANCQLWGKQAESMGQYLIKGKQVGITGEVTLRQYQKQDGTSAQSLDVRVSDLTLLGSREEGQAAPRHPTPQRQAQKQAPAPAADFDEDIPF